MGVLLRFTANGGVAASCYEESALGSGWRLQSKVAASRGAVSFTHKPLDGVALEQTTPSFNTSNDCSKRNPFIVAGGVDIR